MPLIVVFDTNVLFSATGWQGRPYECVELARSGAVEAITCPQLLDELAEKLQVKLSFSPMQIEDTLTDLLTFLRLVPITGTLKVVNADPKDDMVLECAIVGGATHIVTGDRKHLLPLGSYQEVAIVSPADFLKLVSQTNSP